MTTTTKSSKPISNFKDLLHRLESHHDRLASAKSELEKGIEEAAKAYRIAVDAAKGVNKSLPDRFLCGTWLFVFNDDGSVEAAEIPGSEPYELLDLARELGEESPNEF